MSLCRTHSIAALFPLLRPCDLLFIHERFWQSCVDFGTAAGTGAVPCDGMFTASSHLGLQIVSGFFASVLLFYLDLHVLCECCVGAARVVPCECCASVVWVMRVHCERCERVRVLCECECVTANAVRMRVRLRWSECGAHAVRVRCECCGN